MNVCSTGRGTPRPVLLPAPEDTGLLSTADPWHPELVTLI